MSSSPWRAGTCWKNGPLRTAFLAGDRGARLAILEEIRRLARLLRCSFWSVGQATHRDGAWAQGIGHSRRFHAHHERGADLPAPMRWLQRLLVRAAVEMTPEPVRSLPELRDRGLRFGEAALVRAMGRAAALLPLGDTPPAQAARRLATGGRKQPRALMQSKRGKAA